MMLLLHRIMLLQRSLAGDLSHTLVLGQQLMHGMDLLGLCEVSNLRQLRMQLVVVLEVMSLCLEHCWRSKRGARSGSSRGLWRGLITI